MQQVAVRLPLSAQNLPVFAEIRGVSFDQRQFEHMFKHVKHELRLSVTRQYYGEQGLTQNLPCQLCLRGVCKC